MKHHHLAFRFPLLLALLIFGVGGCANSKSAQQLALATLKATATYENEVDKKIAAEKRFIKDQLENIRTSLGGTPLDPSLTDPERHEALRGTWLYAHIRVTAARDGLMTAGYILSKNTALSSGLTVDYLERGIQDDATSIAEAKAKQAALQESLVKVLGPLAKQKNRLKEIRKGLTTLAAGRGEGDRFALALALAKALAEEMDAPVAGQ